MTKLDRNTSDPIDQRRSKEKSEGDVTSKIENEIQLEWEDLGDVSKEKLQKIPKGLDDVDLSVAMERVPSFEEQERKSDKDLKENQEQGDEGDGNGRRRTESHSQRAKASGSSSSDPEGTDTIDASNLSDSKGINDPSLSDQGQWKRKSQENLGMKWGVKYSTYLVSILVREREREGDAECVWRTIVCVLL